MRGVFVSMAVALLLLVPQPAAAQQPFEQCGDLTLVFRNPDLQRSLDDGRVHASGNLFAQFQAIGEQADEIAVFGFSFGPVASPITEEEALCDGDSATWFTGAYVQNYRADTNPDDGFFINLQTALVPDGEYTAAVHAYDSDNKELARAWTNAIVNNCDAPGPIPPGRCPDNAAELVRNDGTAPWPIMLPGDGQIEALANVPADATLSLEFPEPLSSKKVLINGEDITDQLQEWEGRLWDNDLIPGYGPEGLGAILVPECSQSPPQQCEALGEAWYYNQPVTDEDVVRVEAIDLNGNLAIKELHIGSGITGAITADKPVLQITVDELSKTVNAGEPAVFLFRITNSGGADGHPIKSVAGPDDWELQWTAHEPVRPGETSNQELSVLAPPGTPVGSYRVNATISWASGAGTDKQDWSLRVNVGDVPTDAETNEDDDEDDSAPGSKESPGLPVVALLLLVAAIAVTRRR